MNRKKSSTLGHQPHTDNQGITFESAINSLYVIMRVTALWNPAEAHLYSPLHEAQTQALSNA